MAIIIRKGEEKDFPVLMGLIKDLASFEKMPDEVKNSLEQMMQEKELFRFFIAEENGEILGTAIYFFAYSTWVGKTLYLEDLYVKPEYRRKKVGTMLLRKIFKLAKYENCKRVRWQVLSWNKDAIAFYKKHGAKISDQWFNCDFNAPEIKKFLNENSD